MPSTSAIRITPVADRTVKNAVKPAVKPAAGFKVFRQLPLFVDDLDGTCPDAHDVIGEEVIVKRKNPVFQTDADAIKQLTSEKKSLERTVEKLNQKLSDVSQQALKALALYKSKSVSIRRYERQVSRTEEQRKLARTFSSRCDKLRRIKLSIEKTLERKVEIIDHHKTIIAEMKSHLDHLDRYIAEKERDLDRQQHFIDKCMMNLQKAGKKSPCHIPSAVCIDCNGRFPMFCFQLRVPRGLGVAKSWCISPICNGCRKERLKRVDKWRREKRATYHKFMLAGEKEEKEEKDVAE